MDSNDRVLPQLEIFSRPGCHLCEQLLEELLPIVRDQLEVKVRNIETRDDWMEAYATLIPVICFEGREVCHYSLDRAAIQRILGAHIPSNPAS